jgi:monofunctional biosynthetic peptidoglycan transglycosylase
LVIDGPSFTPKTSLEHDEDLNDLYDAERSAGRWYRRRRYWVTFVVVIFLIWFIPFVPALFFSTITVTRLDARGYPIEVDVGPGTKQWVDIEKVSRHLVNAVIVAEDAKFYQHTGFDFQAIAKAIELNRKKGRYVRGASTISQQVVKIAFLSREKTIVRKVREAMGTLLLETLMSKDKILEWYINLCEFGGGIYGVKSAGAYYFKTRPELLTIEQAVNLAVVIPSPNKWSKGLRAKSLTQFGQKRFARIVNNLYLANYITDVQRQTALARGNFGYPITGYGALSGDDDDCGGDKECEDGAADARDGDQPPAAAPQGAPNIGSGPPQVRNEQEPETFQAETPSDTVVLPDQEADDDEDTMEPAAEGQR